MSLLDGGNCLLVEWLSPGLSNLCQETVVGVFSLFHRVLDQLLGLNQRLPAGVFPFFLLLICCKMMQKRAKKD